MKVVKRMLVRIVGLIGSSLLLVFAANCSFERQVLDEFAGKQTEKATAEERAKEEYVVANSFCIACHYDFEEEELALDHELAGIGCERCHGESERHRSDEDNITPPELMYPKSRINPTCMMCHPRHEIIEVDAHGPLFAGAKTIFDEAEVPGAGPKEKYCTDCHGKQHRIKVRTVRWDKATGELIEGK